MSIPETTLQGWSRQGATKAAIYSHEAIRSGLGSHTWSDGYQHQIFLQGSYKNSTNIRGDSDVDVVVLCENAFWSNLNAEQKQRLGLTKSSLTHAQFRQEVILALQAKFGYSRINTSSNKSIKVDFNSGGVPADVIPCFRYRLYKLLSLKVRAQGITFFPLSGGQIINYPEQHYQNGASKSGITSGKYKETVRIFKNARNHALQRYPQYNNNKISSYHLECFIWNAPPQVFHGSKQAVFVQMLDWMVTSLKTPQTLTTVSGLQPLIGTDSVHWSNSDAIASVSMLIKLWKEW